MAENICMPARIIWGSNAVEENSAIFSQFGKTCLIVTGKSGAIKSGALADAEKALNKENIRYEIFDEIGENPLLSACFSAGRKAAATGADFILGIGGGSVLDASKAIAIYASNPELDPNDIYKRVYNNSPLPVILIGLTAGTGSEVTGVAVLTNDETGIKKSISGPDCYAAVSFCDSKYTATVPYDVTVSTALDAFAHVVEGYFTAKCNKTVLLYANECIPKLYQCLKELAQCRKISLDLRERLYDCSILAGLVINTCGTAFPHPLGYVLTENYGIPHGTACAAFFAPFIERCAEFAPEKANKFFELTEDMPRVKALISSLTDLKGIAISPEEAKKYALRWQDVIPRNFPASPGGLTQREAAEILAGI